jgi:tripartite-type tricarboxylate transporter receptor subunit TctC
MAKPVTAAIIAAALSACAFQAAHAADNYPNRAVRMIVPFPVAGATDILARVVAQTTGELFGQQVVVDNRPGAGGTLGSRIAVTANPDGYTLLMGTTSTHAIGPHLYAKPPYDSLTDFSHITQVATSPNVLLVASQVPAQSIKELVALAKAQPGKLNYGSSGTGTQFHLSGELLKLLAGINIVHVPYKGTALVYPDMFSGTIQILFDVPPVALPFIKQGRPSSKPALPVTTPISGSAFLRPPRCPPNGLTAYTATSSRHSAPATSVNASPRWAQTASVPLPPHSPPSSRPRTTSGRKS